ncbi:MAG: tetratricopeptide repeat protein [Kiritimatiellae bacterium]|nr:tetratricopeptide repeat protein [Kiritimatiellia bacterium]
MTSRTRFAVACLLGLWLFAGEAAFALGWPFGSRESAEPAPAATAVPAAPQAIETPSPRDGINEQAEKLQKAFAFFRQEQDRMQTRIRELEAENQQIRKQLERLEADVARRDEMISRLQKGKKVDPALLSVPADAERKLETERRLRKAQEETIREKDRELDGLRQALDAREKELRQLQSVARATTSARREARAAEAPPPAAPAVKSEPPVAAEELPVTVETVVEPESIDEQTRGELAAMSPAELISDANALLQRGQVRDAEMRFSEALARDGSLLNALLGYAACRYSYGDFAAARQSIREILERNPQYAEALGLQGIIAWREGDVAAAVSTLRSALDIDPDSAQLHNYMGILLHAQDDLAGAADEFKKAAALDDKHVEARFNLAVILASEDPPQADEAKRYYEEALKLGSERNEMLEEVLYP